MKRTTIAILCATFVVSACGKENENTTPAATTQTAATVATVAINANTDAATQDKLVTYFIAPELKDCVGVAPQKCMQIKKQENDDWTYFYSQIEGFSFEEGYQYKIAVREENIPNPPMDASSIKYELVEIISKEAVQ